MQRSRIPRQPAAQKRLLAGLACWVALLGAPPAPRAAERAAAADRELALGILRELVAINTAPSGGPGQTRRAAEAMARRLVAAGFPAEDVRVLGLEPGDGNLVARYRGKGAKRPILLMAHLDVVDALPSDWSLPPFELTERDGYLYGRGSLDNKGGAAMLVANLIRMKRAGYEPDRDLILLLTADEETTGANLQWLLREHRELLDAEYALNTDAGAVLLDGDRPQAFTVQTSEKIYQSFVLEARNPGGHSSLPRRDNAIYALADALARLEAHHFPIELNETTQKFFERWQAVAAKEVKPIAAAVAAGRPDAPEIAELPGDPYLNALARTTCVATLLEGGHAENALPQTARATVNCRIVPTSSAAETERILRQVVADPGIEVSAVAPATPSPPSPLHAEVFAAVEKLSAELWPGIPIIPEMSTGATDGLFVRNAGIPTYGVSGVAEDPREDRAHGKDERMRKKSFYDALDFLHRLLTELSR
jgi:acetylornithine deacetylase/succinyl-diaminopimelate desuccinylase-like protein